MTEAQVAAKLREYALQHKIEERWKLIFKGGTTITLSPWPRGKVHIRFFQTPWHNRRRGYGRAALEEVCRWADEQNIPLVLCCAPHDDGMPYQKLHEFYMSFGFDPDEKDMSWMTRQPNCLTYFDV